MVRVTGVHNKEDMQKKCVELMNTEIDLYKNVPYKWYVFDDYSDDES